MANVQHWPVQSNLHEVKVVAGTFVGNAAASPTVVSGAVASVVRTGAGLYTVTFRAPYVSLVNPLLSAVGPTKLSVRATAHAITAAVPTMTIECTTPAGVATDAAVTDTIYMTFLARNSNA
jgi:hypothetical protein